MFNSLAFRLTLLYACISVATLFAVLSISFFSLKNTMYSRFDSRLETIFREFEGLYENQDFDIFTEVIVQEATSIGTDRVYMRIINNASEEVFTTDNSAWKNIDFNAEGIDTLSVDKKRYKTIFDPHHRTRIRIFEHRISETLTFQICESTSEISSFLQYFQRISLLASFIGVVFSFALGSFMARRALRGVRSVTNTAFAISAGDRTSRVPISKRRDEIDELSRAFNQMLEQIESLINELKEVSEDIAHDLRTPIMRIRAQAESALTHRKGQISAEEIAGGVIEECDQLLNLINTMLEISGTELGTTSFHPEEIDLTRLINNVSDLFQPAAEDKGISLQSDVNAPLKIVGDPNGLNRSLAHIIDNAIKYSHEDTSIRIRCETDPDYVRIYIQDQGIGIPEDELDNIFTRFFRVDKSRSTPGNGLGLSLTRAVCRAMGGDLSVESTLGKGSLFVMIIPTAT